MPSRLAERLQAARGHLFVGRETELDLFRSALDAEALPFYVLHVYGPGGVGKTSLLRAFSRLSEEEGAATIYVDVRDVEPAPEAFLDTLRQVLALPPGAPPAEALAKIEGRKVLLIDTFETIASLDGWLRERFLPGLPDDVLTVLAGREPLPPVWRTDPGWQALIASLPLRNLDNDEARAFLDRRDVPAEEHETVLSFTHGHPLATSLVADLLEQQPQSRFRPEAAQDIIKTLLEQFVQHVPGPAHRAALEACALVRFTTESLLQAMLSMPDVHGLFGWLRGLSFVEAGERGLFLHDLAREVLAADLRWRNPEWHAELHRRARQFYTDRLKKQGASGDRSLLSDYAFLHRNHPLVRPLMARLRSQWEASTPLLHDRGRPADLPPLLAMVERHEGAAAAHLAECWIAQQPDGVTVYRDEAGAPQGLMLTLFLDKMTPEDRAADPATDAAWRYLEDYAPLRAGEHATMFRFWMAADTYQDVSPVQSLIFLNRVQHYLYTPGLAFTFVPCRDADFWGPIFGYAAMQPLPEAGFAVAGQTYAVYGHDWRAVSPTAWLDLLAARQPGDTLEAAPSQSAAPVVVLSRPRFAEAVHDAFRAFTLPADLRGNPLLRARLVTDRTGVEADETDRIETLRHLLEETTGALDADPREARYYRAVHRTYLQPAPTQEKAAELLDLPYSTFRRHLKRGLDHVTDILWQQEIGHL